MIIFVTFSSGMIARSFSAASFYMRCNMARKPKPSVWNSAKKPRMNCPLVSGANGGAQPAWSL